MKPQHHPLPETLISFASGTLPSSIASVVACHLSMCDECAEHARALEMWAGLMLEQLTPSDADRAVAEQAAERFSGGELLLEDEVGHAAAGDAGLLPEPLAQYLNGRDVDWTELAPGAEAFNIELPEEEGQMKLLRLAPGQLLLEHIQIAGAGLGLVLEGAFRDHTGDYSRGDVFEWTDDSAPRPIVGGDRPAICLMASEAQPDEAATPHDGNHGKRRPLPQSLWRWQRIELPLSLAASLSLVAGIGIGWLLGSGGGDDQAVAREFLRLQNNRLVAQGPLANALETLPSGRETAVALSEGQAQFGLRMTFRDQTGRFCRQYWITLPASAYHSGVACRSDGLWLAQLQALVPPPGSGNGRIVPAGSDPVMDAVVASLIRDDPLGPDAEAGLLDGGWTE